MAYSPRSASGGRFARPTPSGEEPLSRSAPLEPRAARRICICSSTAFWGGGEKWCLDTGIELARRGHDVSLTVFPGSELERRARARGLPLQSFAITGRSWANPLFLRRAAGMLRANGIDTIIFNGPKDVKAMGIASYAAGVPTRVYRRHVPLPIRGHAVNRFLINRVLTRIVANSEATRAAVLGGLEGALDSARIDVVWNGVDLQATNGAWKEHRSLRSADACVVGHVGRLTPEKGHLELLSVARRLVDDGVRFRLLLAGEGPLEQELRATIDRLDLEAHVKMLGFVDDIPAFFGSVDVLAFPSRWEGFGYSVVEAAAAGVPTVAFDVSSMGELVVDGETGLLVTPRDLDAYAAGIARLAGDAELRTGMGRRARRRVETSFRLGPVTSALEASMWGPEGD